MDAVVLIGTIFKNIEYKIIGPNGRHREYMD